MAIKTNLSQLEEGYRTYKNLAAMVKKYCDVKSIQFQAGSVNADNVLGVFHDMRRWAVDLSTLAAIPGIVQYARDVEADQAYDPVAEYLALESAMDSLKLEIRTTFPVDGNGFLLEKTWNAQDTYDFRQFTVAQLSTIVALIDAVGNTIETVD